MVAAPPPPPLLLVLLLALRAATAAATNPRPQTLLDVMMVASEGTSFEAPPASGSLRPDGVTVTGCPRAPPFLHVPARDANSVPVPRQALVPGLVPWKLSTAPHYYTTWGTQGYMPGDCQHNLTVDFVFSHQGASQEAALCSDYVFGKPGLPGSGWLQAFYPTSRAEMFFLLDNGYASDARIEPSTTRFPQWNQSDPAQRLLSFNKAVKAAGWRGLGLWSGMKDPAYCVQAANWSKQAGITYWKIDGVDNDCACSKAAKAVFPSISVEHGFCPVVGCPLNDPSGGKVYPRRAAEAVMPTLGCSDIFRSYDTVPTLSIPITLSRLSTILDVANDSLPAGDNEALVNGDAESLVTNGLGCAVGVMRSPVTDLRPPFKDAGMSEARDVDLFFMGNRQAKKRIDEVDRIIRWGRLAAPFGARAEGGADIRMDPLLLCDAWAFEPGDTWDKNTWGKTLEQCAPARVTRGGLPLPTVESARTVAPPTAVQGMEPCAQASDSTQVFVKPPGAGGGEWTLQSRKNRCLMANSSGLYTAECLQTSSSIKQQQEEEHQVFFLDAEGRLKQKHSGLCITANCSVVHNNSSGDEVACARGAELWLAPCLSSSGPPMQSFVDIDGKLMLRATNYHPSSSAVNNSHCQFGQHTSQIQISATATSFTVTSASTSTTGSGNGNVIGSCSDAATLSYSITVKKLTDQVFFGFSQGSLTDWVNVPGAWGYGSTGIRGSYAGYNSSGLEINPKTGQHYSLDRWNEGDVIAMSVDANGVMTASRNKQQPVVLYTNVSAGAKKVLTLSVWTAPGSSGSTFSFTGEAGAGDMVPSCITAALVSTSPAVPFVVSTRYPDSHAVSISTLARTSPRPIGYHTPLVNVSQPTLLGLRDATVVTQDVEGVEDEGELQLLPPIGVFGSFGNLALGFLNGTASRIVAVHAQDLRGEEPVDITQDVFIDATTDTVTLSGALITRVGTMARTIGDLSEPGLVIVAKVTNASAATSTRL